MRKIALTLIVGLFTFASIVNAEPRIRTNSYLPLELKETLKLELSDPAQEFTSEMNGNVWVRFNINENGAFEITELSSNNIPLGYFVMNVLKQLPDLSKDCPVGGSYAVKISICCPDRINY